ncbi:MAG: hypothetical protein Q9179_008003, partial [Wetmoreana sp. 5 TL-2023]
FNYRVLLDERAVLSTPLTYHIPVPNVFEYEETPLLAAVLGEEDVVFIIFAYRNAIKLMFRLAAQCRVSHDEGLIILEISPFANEFWLMRAISLVDLIQPSVEVLNAD